MSHKGLPKVPRLTSLPFYSIVKPQDGYQAGLL